MPDSSSAYEGVPQKIVDKFGSTTTIIGKNAAQSSFDTIHQQLNNLFQLLANVVLILGFIPLLCLVIILYLKS